MIGIDLPIMAHWGTVGSPGFSSGSADNLSLAVSQAGVPYVAYAEYNTTQKISVRKFISGNWSIVGNPDFSAGYAEAISLAINPVTNEPYVAYVDWGNSHKATVMRLDNTSNTWVNVGIAGFTLSTVNFTCIAFNISGDPHVAFSDFSQAGRASVMKFTTAGGWQYLGSPGFSSTLATYVCLGFQPLTFTPFVAFSDHQFIPAKPTVMQYSSPGIGSPVWNNVGPAGFTMNEAKDLSLAFKPLTNEPYLAFVDYQGPSDPLTAIVKKYNYQYSTWDNVGTNPVYPGNAENTKLAFSPCGKPLVAFIDGSNSNKATVVKLDNADTWVVLGSSGISSSAISYPDLKFWPSDKLYLGFMDVGNLFKATVMTFDGTLNLTATTIPSTCDAADGVLNLTVNGGDPPFTYQWSNSANTQDISNLTCGVYSVTVTDNYCNVKTGNWLYEDLIIKTCVTYKADCQGSIDLTVTCGTPPYSYFWNNMVTTEDLTGTCTGVQYCVLVVDANNLSKNCCVSKKKSACDVNFLENIAVQNGMNGCYESFGTIYVAGNGTTFTVQNGGSATMIAGEKISYLPGTKVYQGGSMHGYITTTGQYCGNKVNNNEVSGTGFINDSISIPDIPLNQAFNTYPNPTAGKFILELNAGHLSTKRNMEIYSMRGEKVLAIELSGEQKHEISLSDQPAGLYFLRIVTGNHVMTGKVIRQN